ncbi:MAG: aldo/keto reductase [Spirochaetaceae bacterium]|nr:MAG: aldo/keto reductase [Spirochaetaceae bacterium]
MKHTHIDGLDTPLPRLIVGLWGITGGAMWGDQDESDSIHAIQSAIDHGMYAFDTAEGYGNGYSEEVLGKAIADMPRESAVILSKASPENLSAEKLIASCEASLKRLGSDYIDVYQLHWPNTDVPIAETVAGLEKLKAQGKIRSYGVSNFGPKELEELYATDAKPVTNQLSYSLMFRAIELEILPLLQAHGTGVIAYSALLHGILTGKYRHLDDIPEGRTRTRHFSSDRPGTRHGTAGHEKTTAAVLEDIRVVCDDAGVSMREAALQWILSQDGITAALVGVRNEQQAAENARLFDTTIPSAVLEKLSEASRPLREEMGPHADMWTIKARIR